MELLVKAYLVKKMRIQQFRIAVYQSILKRADAMMDLIDALTVAGHVGSPVALSEETPFRRKFSSIFDTLLQGEFDFDRDSRRCMNISQLNSAKSWQDAKCTVWIARLMSVQKQKRWKTGGHLKTQKEDPVRYGHKYSWLVRLIQWGTSWEVPADIQRVDTGLSDSQVGNLQVQELALRNPEPKIIVADSLYGNYVFLAVFLVVKNVFALVRLRSNQVFYGRPKPHPKGTKGAPAKHGAKFKLSQPSRLPDQTETFLLGEQTVKSGPGKGCISKSSPDLVGMLLRVEFLRADGTPRYKRSMWLFWTGPETVHLRELCRMYLWRFAIEHLFRFLKQHLGLNANQSTDLVSCDQWMWLCALAYWQLLLMRATVSKHVGSGLVSSQNVAQGANYLTPRQVQRGAFRYLVQLGTPARNTRTAGKAKVVQKVTIQHPDSDFRW